MNPIMVSALALSLAACGSAFAKAEETAPVELEKMVVTPRTSGTVVYGQDSGDLKIGDTRTIVSASGAVIDLKKTHYGVEIYVDGDLLGISEHLTLP